MKEAAAKDCAADPALEARRRVGNVTLYQEQARDMWSFPSLDSFVRDVRYSLRTLRRAPAFSVVAVLALALGIGANTAVYSLVHSLLVDGLPYRDSESLVLLIGNVEREQVERRGNSYPDHLDWRAAQRSFDDIAAFTNINTTLRSIAEPERLAGEAVSPSYFSLLGVAPAHGRVFREDEDSVPDRDAVVVLSDALWRRSFGGDPSAINRPILLGARQYTVIGIMPPAFTGLTDEAQLWMPFAMSGTSFTNRGNRGFSSLARLKPGVSLETARAEMATISARLATAFPASNEKRSVEVALLSRETFGSLRAPLIALMVAVVFVLLIACANVANLMVTRADVRGREIALRTALGAGRARLLRQLITEGVVLAALGAVLGVALAAVALRALIAASPVTLPSFSHPALQWPVLGFTLALTLGTGIILGLAPAVHSRIGGLADALKTGSRGSHGGTRRLRGLLVAVEVALTVVLSVGAGLMIRTVQNLSAIAPGFDTANVLTMNATIPRQSPPAGAGASAAPPPFVADWRTLLAAVRAVPGVASAALSSDSPFGDSSAVFFMAEGDATFDPQRVPRAYVHRVSPSFFETLGISFRAGRTFDAGELAADSTAIIVSEPLARRFWSDGSAIGRRLKAGSPQNPWLTIVGVVPELKYRGLPENPTKDPDIFFPISDRGQQSVIVRASSSPESAIQGVRTALRSVSSAIVPFGEQALDDVARRQTAPSRFLTWLLGTFAASALLLATIGLYGVMSYLVEQRSREIGIRLALGAGRGSIVTLVLREAGMMVVLGLAAGAFAAWPLRRLLQSQLVGISSADPSAFVAVALLALVALAACVMPTWRATRVEPVVALRND